MTLDQFNSMFPFIACISPIFNIKKLLKDKEVKGVHWFVLVTYGGQVSGIYFMYSLKQWWTLAACSTFFVLSFAWYCMMVYYNLLQKKLPKG